MSFIQHVYNQLWIAQDLQKKGRVNSSGAKLKAEVVLRIDQAKYSPRGPSEGLLNPADPWTLNTSSNSSSSAPSGSGEMLPEGGAGKAIATEPLERAPALTIRQWWENHPANPY